MKRPKRGVSNSDKVAEMPRFPGVTCGLVIILCIIICIACLAYRSNAFIPAHSHGRTLYKLRTIIHRL